MVLERYEHVAALRAEIRIPVLQVTNADCATFIAALNGDASLAANGTLLALDAGNTFLEASNSVGCVVFQVVVIGLSVASIGVSLSRLVPFLRVKGWEWSMQPIVLLLEILGAIMRFLYGIDPFGMRSIYDPFTVNFLFSPHAAVSLICDLVILFYWNNALSSFGTKSIAWTKKYVYSVTVIIALAEVVSATCRGFELSIFVYIFIPILYITVQSVIIGYIIYTSVGVIRFFRESSKLNAVQEQSKTKVIRMGWLLVFIAATLVGIIVLAVVGVIPYTFDGAVKQMVMGALVCTFVSLNGICVALVFRKVSAKPVRSSSKSKSKAQTKSGAKSENENETSTLDGQQMDSRIVGSAGNVNITAETWRSSSSSASSTAPAASESTVESESDHPQERRKSEEKDGSSGASGSKSRSSQRKGPTSSSSSSS